MDQQAQVSAELIIVIAALIAVAIVFVTQLQQTAQKGRDTINTSSNKLLGEIEELAKIK